MVTDKREYIYGKEITFPNQPNRKNVHFMSKTEKRLSELQPHIPKSLYNIDENGSRIPEEPLPYDGLILFFGCSYTVGQGVNAKDSYPYRVAKQLKMNYYNLGACGAGPTRCYILAQYWIPKLKPDLVVYGVPGGNRIFAFEPDDVELWTQNKYKTFGQIIIDYEQYIRLDKRNAHVNVNLSSDAFNWFCHINNAKLFTWHANRYYYEKSLLDKGSDGIHPGPETHKLFANIILKGLDKPLIP